MGLRQQFAVYREAHKSYSKLSEADPKRYRPYFANALSNFAVLYFNMRSLEEAEEAYGEALPSGATSAKAPRVWEGKGLGKLSSN